MEFTIENKIKLAEYLFGKENIQGEINLDLTDWRIIKALESKMCEELGVKRIEYLYPYQMRVLYVASYYFFAEDRKQFIRGHNNIDIESAILSAINNHVNKEVK